MILTGQCRIIFDESLAASALTLMSRFYFYREKKFNHNKYYEVSFNHYSDCNTFLQIFAKVNLLLAYFHFGDGQ